MNNGILDISGDIANFNMVRRSDAVSTFNFTLQNTQRKYDGIFRPGDRLTVSLKRITWVPVFTGTLNNSPIFSAWPRALPMSASCTLKKIQFWPWDPNTAAAQTMISTAFSQDVSNPSAVGDGGLSKLATVALNQVAGWDPQAIHFGSVPNRWFDWAKETADEINRASSMQAVLGAGIINGQVSASALKLIAGGLYGGIALSQEQLDNASSIYAVIVSNSNFTTDALQDTAAKIAFMTVMQESTLHNLSGGDRDSVGLFQQRPSQGWGTVAECMDIGHATTAFLNHLIKIPNWSTMDPGQAAQAVQISAYPSAYSKWASLAYSLVTALRYLYNQAKKSPTGSRVGISPPTGSTSITGLNLASVAANLITSRPPGSIRYSQSGRQSDTTENPTVLDCSALTAWVWYHTVGTHITAYSGAQYDMCSSGGHIIPVDLAAQVQGAFLFIGDSRSPGGEHVGISIGNNQHVAAHTDSAPLIKQVDISPISGSGFTTAGLMPGIDYTNAATTQDAANKLKIILGKPTSVATSQVGSGSNPNITTTGSGTGASVTQQIVTALTYQNAAQATFGGARELINNVTFLPWIKNIVNSSMRSFCSAPNGDFIAWFPDYFNVWGTAASMSIQPIELQDFTVDWSDQQIVTHEFVIGTYGAILDSTSGGLIQNNSVAQLSTMINTQGIASMEFPQIFHAIYGKDASAKFVTDYLTRFGARPNLDQMVNVQAGATEFYMALWNFMLYWSSQFTATIPLTFMPELYPGMIIKIPAFDFQAYVTEVEHSGSFGQNGQFTTNATIIAPARTSSATDLFGILPLGGS